MEIEKKDIKIQDVKPVVDGQPPAQAAAQTPAPAQSPGTDPNLVCYPAPVNRTPGLKVFDAFLYPFLTNFVVFGLSVAATYLTSKGHLKDANGKLIYGKTGEWFAKRGKWMDRQFESMGMNKSQAEMGRMVFFSFADGTAVAPMVKLLEDRREKIAKWIDDRIGTKPEDELTSYKAEPKQSWFSVVMGRLAVVSIVVPTAVALDKTGLNDVLFSRPGQRFGEWAAQKPEMVKFFERFKIPKAGIPEIGKVGAFELFYTSVCTGGLYFASRYLARMTNRKKTGEMESILDENGKDLSTEIVPQLAKKETPAEQKPAHGPDSLMTASAEPAPKKRAANPQKQKRDLLEEPPAHYVDAVHQPEAVMERI